MFTGIIAGLGEILNIRRTASEARYEIKPLFKMADIIDGESIAVNGVCLSVERHKENSFMTYASAETLARTNLNYSCNSQKVNLERALALGDRLGGHIISGHIDCVARVIKKEQIGSSLKFRLEYPEAYFPQVVAKGSIALNGISLTINACESSWLEVNIIPDSQKRTNITSWTIGTPINMETDIIGKYVQHMLAPWQKDTSPNKSYFALLSQNGFL